MKKILQNLNMILVDYSKLVEAQEKNIFSDVKLIITNGTDTFELHLHKIILSTSCTYFEKLLTSFNERNSREIRMYVEDVNAMHDTIMMIYQKETNIANYPKWKWILRQIQCLDYLGLPWNKSILTSLTVPTEGLELLVNVIDRITGHQDDMIDLLIDNLPEDFDLDKLPSELAESVREKLINCQIVTVTNNMNLFLWSQRTKNFSLIKKFPLDLNNIDVSCFCILIDSKQIAYSDNTHQYVKVINVKTGKLEHCLEKNQSRITCMCHSSKNRQIATGEQNGTVRVGLCRP